MPDYRKGNPYQSRLQSSLKDVDVTVSYDNFPAGLFPLWQACKRHPNISVIHIHWIVELIRHIVWSSNPIIFRFKCFLLVLDCYLLKLRGVKLVWTIHNKLAHEGFDPHRETYIRGRLAKAVSRIIVHSQEALEAVSDLYKVDIKNKTQVIFHGNYIGVYPCPSDSLQNLRDQKKLSSEAIVVSYVGMMRPYKGLELLIDTFKGLPPNEQLCLLIAGKPANQAYQDKLLALIDSHPRILSEFGFLAEQSMIDYLHLSDVVCLPFSDTLTSGSTLLAMSNKQALILPEAAKVFGCVPAEGVYYFKDASQLKNILVSLDKTKLSDMAQHNFVQAQAMSWPIVGQLTQSVYR